jgi:hypothetical protein
MLDIMLHGTDEYPSTKLTFEHSLVSVSKWEAIVKRPFFGHEEKTAEDTEIYYRCMLLTEDPPANFYQRLVGTPQFQEIADYINTDQHGTKFREEPTPPKSKQEIVSSELIYYWLVQFQIPFQPTETWHLSKLMALVKVAGLKQSKPKKMSAQERAAQMRALNEQRRRETGSAG